MYNYSLIFLPLTHIYINIVSSKTDQSPFPKEKVNWFCKSSKTKETKEKNE